jgi:hypothetical protein
MPHCKFTKFQTVLKNILIDIAAYIMRKLMILTAPRTRQVHYPRITVASSNKTSFAAIIIGLELTLQI